MSDALHIATLAACFGEAEDALWVIDREGRVRYANAAAERAGAGRELWEATERLRRVVIESGGPAHAESCGERGAYTLRATPVFDAERRVVAVSVVAARDHRRPEHERLRAMIVHAPALVAIMRGPDHVYELVSERFCRAVPGARALLGTSARAHRSDLVAQQFVELLDHVYETGETYESFEVPHVVEGEAGPTTVYYSFVHQPIRGREGRVEGIASVAFDVTESVLARKQVEEASRAKDDFLSTLSHELRTPLNAIVGWSHLLRTGALQGVQTQRALESIDRNAKVQKRLIDDLLDFSRMVSGKLALHESAVDVEEVMAAAIESIRPAAEAKSISLELRVEAQPWVVGDPDRLQQVMANLLSNAVKFTGPRGRVRVALRAPDESAAIEVHDDGLGIDPQFLPHVFERFRQADGSTTRPHGGLGLGLAIARAIIEMHGGCIEAESQGLGLGTRISVVLPRLDDETRAEVQRSIRGLRRAGARLAGVHVLFVDDEPEARALADAVLRQAGADVFLADSAAGALEALHEGGIDVLVSDLGMPHLDGITLIERVRAMPAPLCRIPALALTGHARGEDRARAVDAGYDAFLTKPLDVDAFVTAIAHAAGRIGGGTG